MSDRYQVVVGNIGTVYSGDDEGQAIKTYEEYVKQSEAGKGRASNEDVTLLCDDAPIREHTGEHGPITVLQLAFYRGAKETPSGSVSMGAVEEVGLPFMGGCVRCHATVACYNACPTNIGYIACKSGCAKDIGYATVEEANRALFPEEYEWKGVGYTPSKKDPNEDQGEGHHD